DGTFTLDIENNSGEYTIVAVGGIDTATNQYFDGVLKEIVEIAKDQTTITSKVLTPLTTIATEVYIEEKAIDTTFTPAKAKEIIAENLGLTLTQISKNPLKDKEVFAKTQKIVQAIKILAVTIQKDTTSRSVNQDAFNHVLKQVAKTIKDDNSSNDINISKVVTELEDVQYKSEVVTIDDSIEEFVQSYVDDVEEKIKDTNTTSDLTFVQNGLETYIAKIVTIIKTVNVSTTLDNNLSSTLTDVKDKDVKFLIESAKNRNSIAIRSIVISRGDTTTNSYVTIQCGSLGGIAVYTGVDSNGDGILGPDEQDSVPQVVCNGATGVTGTTGTSGTDGINGTDGATGKSAYEIWQDLGNIGTQQD
ncbi:MAG: hypothetical protein KAJ49_05220, partial [Arcobacteraceae bacterium]|nr:hypothetical protein [Arcobacteraceae bacterium]